MKTRANRGRRTNSPQKQWQLVADLCPAWADFVWLVVTICTRMHPFINSIREGQQMPTRPNAWYDNMCLVGGGGAWGLWGLLGSIMEWSRIGCGSIQGRSWIDLGSILDRFWIDPGSILVQQWRHIAQTIKSYCLKITPYCPTDNYSSKMMSYGTINYYIVKK